MIRNSGKLKHTVGGWYTMHVFMNMEFDNEGNFGLSM